MISRSVVSVIAAEAIDTDRMEERQCRSIHRDTANLTSAFSRDSLAAFKYKERTMIEGLKDKVVIVTGGGHGIGRAYSLGFGGAGAKVVVADIDEPAAAKVAKEVNSQTDVQSLSVKVDVSNESSTGEMAKLTLERFG